MLNRHRVLGVQYAEDKSSIAQKFAYATAVSLTIYAPFFAKLNGTKITVSLFEVGREIINAVFFCDGVAYLVYERCVFVRTHRQSGGKKVESFDVFKHIFCRVFKSQIETKTASRAAFGV